MHQSKLVLYIRGFAAAALLSTPMQTLAQDTLVAALTGFQEVPSISTLGNGTFRGEISADGTFIDCTLTYSDLGDVTAAHIHFGQRAVSGGIIAFLCGGGDKPDCPDTSGTVTGTIDAADITGPTTQGINLEELAEVLTAIEKRVTYVNVHTVSFASGEIRGQVRSQVSD